RRLLEQRNRADVEAEIAQKGRRSRRGSTEAEVLADRDDARAESAENRFREVRRFEPGELGGELDDERLVHPLLPQQLEPPLERREELDAVPEDDARMRPERDHRRTQTGLLCDIEDCPVSDVHAVEAPERDGALGGFQLVESPRDDHDSRARASSGGIIRSKSASSTENGPISNRRSVRQCPPSTSAIERTYVPELTRRSRLTTPLSYAMTSSASTRDRRTAISTAMPRRRI